MRQLFSFSFTLIFLANLTYATPAQQALAARSSSALTPEAREELKKWSSLKNELGVLLTPPIGNLDPRTKAAKAELTRIINTIAGDELRQKNINLTINIYAADTPNAWAREFDPQYKEGPEQQWHEKNSAVWPIRQMMGFGDNNRTIYEIAVTTGLLSTLKSESELAFALGHELTHLFEGHTKQPDGSPADHAQKWWSGQEYEAVADKGGLDRILGKYELDAAITSLERLFPKELKKKKSMAEVIQQVASSGAEAHHHEGVRLSLLQYQIERYRRFNTKAQPKPIVDMPKALKIQRAERTYVQPSKFLSETLPYFDNYLKTMILKGNLDPVIFGNEKIPEDKIPNLDGAQSLEELEKLLLTALSTIEASNVSKSAKVNAFLHFRIMMRGVLLMNPSMDELSPETKNQLALFLAKNSSGADGWRFQDFVPTMQRMSENELMPIQTSLLYSNNLEVFSRLKTVFPEWQKLFVAMIPQNPKGNLQKLWQYISAYRSAVYLEDSKASNEFIELMLEQVKQFSPNDVLEQKKDGRLTFAFLRSMMKSDLKEANPLVKKRAKRFAEAFAPLQTEFISRTVKNAMQTDGSRSFVEKLTSVVALSEDVRFASLSPADKLRVRDVMVEIANEYNRSPENNGSGFSGLFIAQDYTNEIIKLLNSPQHPKATRTNIFYFVIASGLAYPAEADGPTPEVKASIAKFWSERSKQEILAEIAAGVPNWHDKLEKFLTLTLKSEKGEDPFKYSQRQEKEFERLGYSENQTYDIHSMFSADDSARKNLIRLLSYGNGGLPPALQNITLAEFKGLLSTLESSMRTSAFALYGREPNQLIKVGSTLHREAGQVLLDMFLIASKEAPSIEEWMKLYQRLQYRIGTFFSLSVTEEKALRDALKSRLAKLPLKNQFQWLKHKAVRQVLGANEVAESLLRAVEASVVGDKTQSRLQQEIERVTVATDVRNEFPEAFRIFRDKLTENRNLQPGNISAIFPDDKRSETEKVSGSAMLIRGLSSLVTLNRTRPINEQIEMIDFLMGRRLALPDYMKNFETKGLPVDLTIALQQARGVLANRTELERSFVVNSFFLGPNGAYQNPQSVKYITDQILSVVDPKNREIAQIMLNALMRAEKKNKSLFLSYVLAQKRSDSDGAANGKLTQSLVLKSLLDSYGVPGVKLAQYLAFTSEFKDFKDALESYQDAAMPISYYEMLKLVQERLGEQWDGTKYRIVRILGSGSVNIAVEYENLSTGKLEILNISREDIEVKTKEDFRRFRMLTTELAADKVNGPKFEFIKGLMSIIESSVQLEFDKRHSYDMQKSVQKLYDRIVDGWRVQTVDAYEQVGMTIRMEKAPGVGARKILAKDPAMYNSAMAALWNTEYQVNRGVNETGNIIPVPLHANPDLHDGQVMIDVPNRTVTFFDFGQAEKLSNQERELGLDLLMAISGAQNSEKVVEVLQNRYQTLTGKKIQLELSEVKKALSANDRMDRFVRLISMLNRSNFNLPISSVHWVLSSNRLIKLGEKINIPAETSFKHLLVSRKFGLPLTAYNAGAKTLDGIKGVVRPITPPSPAGASKMCSDLFIR